MAGIAPRPLPPPDRLTHFSGLETLTIRADSNFLMVGERANVTGSARFRRLIKGEDFDAAVGPILQMVMGSIASAMPADDSADWAEEDTEIEEEE